MASSQQNDPTPPDRLLVRKQRVRGPTCPRGLNELADDDALIEGQEAVAETIEDRFGEHSSGLLERRSRQ